MITYKRAEMDDLDTLVRLRLEFIDEIKKTHIEDPAVRENLTRYFMETIPTQQFIAWLAVDNGEVVGTSGLCFYQMPPNGTTKDGRVAYIMNMYTKPEYRRQGIADGLFSRILNEAKTLGYTKVSLNASEMGAGLYRKYGFSEPEMIELVKFF